MRSDLTFVMHPDDELEFVHEVLTEPGTLFVNGPSWETDQPPLLSGIENGHDYYLMIWNRSETPPLAGKHHTKDDKEWWYCENEYLTIQFLRSGLHGSFLTEGRIAVGTNGCDPTEVAGVERRFNHLRRWIKKRYTNKVIIWQNTTLPRSPTNPIKPSFTLWVGPQALRWLETNQEQRWIQQFGGSPGLVRGYLLDLVEQT